MSKKCLMVLSPDEWREAAPILLVPAGTELAAAQLPPGAIVVRVGPDGYRVEGGPNGGIGALGEVEAGSLESFRWSHCGDWRLKLGETPGQIEQTILDQTDWAAPEVRVYYAGESQPSLCCRLPTGPDGELIIGRSRRRSHLPLEDEHVSRQHARIFRSGPAQMIEDMGSRGGTFVNDQRIEGAHALAHEDRIRVGSTTLEFVSYLGILEQFERAAEASGVARAALVDGVGPAGGPEAGDATRPAGTANGRRPLLDTVLYGMAILTVLVGLVVLVSELIFDE